MAVGDSITPGYNPATFTLGCGFTKTDDSVSTTPDQTCTAGTLTIDGKYNIYFRFRSRDTKTYEESYRLYTAANKTRYLTNAPVADYDMVEFIMCTNIDDTISATAATGVIDKESVPVIADGANGTQGPEGPAGRDVGENLIDGTGEVKVIDSFDGSGADSSSRWYNNMFTLNDVNLLLNQPYSCQMRVKLEGCSNLDGRSVRIYLSVVSSSGSRDPFICEFFPTENGTYKIKKENFTFNNSDVSQGFYSGVSFGWARTGNNDDITLGTITIDKVKLEAGEKCTAWCLSENDKKGANVPYYHDTDYGWSADATTGGINIEPSGVDWSKQVPSKPADKPYLWMRDLLMKWNSAEQAYQQQGLYTYTRITGEDGNGVEIKGSFTKEDWYGHYDSIELYLSYVYSNPTTGDCYIYQEDGHLWVWNGTKWQDVGQIKGSDGTSQYIHWAWCNILGPTSPSDQGYPSWAGLSGTDFTTSKDAEVSYKYIGVLANNTESPDPGIEYAGNYEWNEVVGPEGPEGSGFKKVDTYLRSYTLAKWDEYMRANETWSLAKTASGSDYYQNTHIKVGDTCYIIGKVSDCLDANGNAIDIAAYGVCKGFRTNGSVRTTIVMDMSHYIRGGTDGKDSVRLALDNEHEDFLYSKDSNGNDLLISPYGGATSAIHLYDGHEEKTTDFTLKVYDDYAGSWVEQTGYSASVNASISGTTLNVVELRTNTAKVKVRAEYPMSSGKYYYAEFTANKTTGDKYDIIVNPNAIAFSTGETWTNKTISVSIEGVNAQGGRLTPTISTGDSYGKDQFRVFWGYVKPDGTIIKPSTASQTTPANGTEDLKARSKTVNQTEANEYIGIYFELRLYTSSTDYRLCDYETVEIAKTVAGKDGWTYEVSNKSVIIDQDMDNESRWYFPEPIKFSVKKGNTPCVFNVTGISCTKEDSNDIIGWNGSGTQALVHPDGFPYDSYSITINSVNGSTATKAVLTVGMSIYDPDTQQAVSHTEKIEVYINRLGTFSRKTMKNVEQALGEAHVYSIDPVTGEVLDNEYLYKEVNSAKESVKTLSEITEHTVNLFPSVTSGWESENGGTSTVVYGDNYSIADSGTDLYSPVVTLEPNTTYCFSGYFGSAPSTSDFLYVLSAVGNYVHVSDLFLSSALSPGSIINNGGGRYYFTFATPDDNRRKMFALNFFGSYQDLSRPQLEAGNAPTTFYPRVQAFSSEVRQTAREIEMKVGKCGIDIDNESVNVKGGKFKMFDSTGTATFELDTDGNLISKGSAQFEGKIKATSGEFTGTIHAGGGDITGNVDITGNGKLTVGTQHRIEISPDGSTWGAKIVGKKVYGTATTQYLSLGFAYANNEFTPELLLGQPNVGSRIRITDEKIEQYLNISSTEGYTIEQGHFGSGTYKAGIIIKNAANKNVKFGIGNEGKVFIQADGWPVVNSTSDLSSIPVGSVCAMAVQALGNYSIRTLAIRVS